MKLAFYSLAGLALAAAEWVSLRLRTREDDIDEHARELFL